MASHGFSPQFERKSNNLVKNNSKQKAVFLDRDGTLNKSITDNGISIPPRKVSEIEFIPGVATAIKLFKQMSYLPVIITNQPDVVRGLMTRSVADEINIFIKAKLNIRYVYTCFHDDFDNCDCRKPKTGLIIEAEKEIGIDLSKSILVGDRWKDIKAAQTIGCSAYYIDYGCAEEKLQKPFTVVNSLLHAAQLVWSKNVI